MSEILYPTNCKPIHAELGTVELFRRMYAIFRSLEKMFEDDGEYQQYIPMALHLAEEQFLTYPSQQVRLLVACCIAEVLKIYAPVAPYKDEDQVKKIFLFLISQLSGLKDPKDEMFKRSYYLLQNLTKVKAFNLCFELEDCEEIFYALFQSMFKMVNDEHSNKTLRCMLDILFPLLSESNLISIKLLNVILINVVEPNKTQRKNAYWLAKEVLVKTHDTLEPAIHAFFNQVLVTGKINQNLAISNKAVDLIRELYLICPQVIKNLKLKYSFEMYYYLM